MAPQRTFSFVKLYARDFNFSFQHDIRFQNRSTVHGVTTTIVTLFDNDATETIVNANRSRGMIIELTDSKGSIGQNFCNSSTQIGTAKLLQDFYAPITPADPKGLLTASQGNVQIFQNNNVRVGWGNNTFISEFSSDGTPLYYAAFNLGFTTLFGNSYRAYKFPFAGKPTSAPSIYSYSLSSSSNTTTTHWVSWNGCTECAFWVFYEGNTANGRFVKGPKVQRTGFETNYTSQGYSAYAYAKALDARGVVLGTSQVERTFVPGMVLADVCTQYGCPTNFTV